MAVRPPAAPPDLPGRADRRRAGEAPPVPHGLPAPVVGARRGLRVRAGHAGSPVLAIGSNAAPSQMRHKFATTSVPLVVPSIRARVEGMTAGFSSFVSPLGYVPATLVPEPGAVAEMSLQLLDDQQLREIDRTEFSGLPPGVGRDADSAGDRRAAVRRVRVRVPRRVSCRRRRPVGHGVRGPDATRFGVARAVVRRPVGGARSRQRGCGGCGRHRIHARGDRHPPGGSGRVDGRAPRGRLSSATTTRCGAGPTRSGGRRDGTDP